MPECGTLIDDRYRLDRVVGRGAFGVVFEAHHLALGARVAVKVLGTPGDVDEDEDASAVATFLDEVRTLKRLRHPGIVAALDAGLVEGTPYFVMEWCDGPTLQSTLDGRGPMTPTEAWQTLEPIFEAIAFAHRNGVVHRDIKPSNVVFYEGVARVIDFGGAKLVTADERAGSGETWTTGRGAFTPRYASPEQLAGARTGPWTDVHALALVFVELLVGRPAIGESGRLAVVDPVRPTPRSFGVDVGALEPVLGRALALRPAERFADAGAFAEAVRRALAPPSRLRRLGVAAGAISLTVAAAAVGARLPNPPPPALANAAPTSPGGASSGGSRAALGPRGLASAESVSRATAGKPVALTALSGCSYSPAFVDNETVAFDLTRDGENHLWTVPAAGGEPVQRTRGPFTEWRAMPGRRPGEIVYLVVNPTGGPGARVATLDLASGESETLTTQNVTTAFFGGDVLHYLRRDGGELRRVRDRVDEVVLNFPSDVVSKVAVGSHDGKRVALAPAGASKPRLCVVELDERRLECLQTPRVLNARPAFSADDASIYYAGAAAVRRAGVAGGDELFAPDVSALGGLAVSPNGSKLVYSDCQGRGPLVDIGETPPKRLSVAAEGVKEPGAGPGGLVAYAQSGPDGSALMLRRADGETIQLGGPFDGRVRQPRFSRDGARVAFVVAGEGLYVLPLLDSLTPMATPISNNPSDEDPAWLPDGRLAFTRRDGESVGAHIVDPAGGPPTPLGSIVRRVVGLRANGRLLMLSFDSSQFVEWDFTLRAERRSTISLGAVGRLAGVTLSSNGRWLAVQAGDLEVRVYRFDLTRPRPEPELVFTSARGQTLDTIAVTDEGHVLAAPITWSGELYAFDAPPGTRFLAPRGGASRPRNDTSAPASASNPRARPPGAPLLGHVCSTRWRRVSDRVSPVFKGEESNVSHRTGCTGIAACGDI